MLKYLVIRTKLINNKDMPELKDILYYKHSKLDNMADCLVYSLQYSRLSYNLMAVLVEAKLSLYFCDSYDDFVAYIQAHTLGTDLSNLWRIDESKLLR